MKIIDPGHKYEVDQLDGSDLVKQTITFVKRFRGGENHPGTTNQELLRVLIHRIKLLDEEKPWGGNEDNLLWLRAVLVNHENRALMRKLEKGEIEPENLDVDPKDGHFVRATR